jgi:hypothetical protein
VPRGQAVHGARLYTETAGPRGLHFTYLMTLENANAAD